MKKLTVLAALFTTNVFAAGANSITATANIDAVCEASINQFGTSEVIFLDTDSSEILSKVSTISIANNSTAQTRLTVNNTVSNIPNFNGGLGLYQDDGTRFRAATLNGNITFDSTIGGYKNVDGSWYIGVFDNNKAKELPKGSYNTTISFTLMCF